MSTAAAVALVTAATRIPRAAAEYLNSYVDVLKDALTDCICAPVLGARAGIAGALLLAEAATSGD